MDSSAEKELYRLTEMLRAISEKVQDPAQIEALQKAGIALTLIYLRGIWEEFEEWYRTKDHPLSASELAQLVEFGIEVKDNDS